MANQSIIKTFDGQPHTGVGVINFCSWERLRPFLEKAASLAPNEYVSGVEVDEVGLNIQIKTKE